MFPSSPGDPTERNTPERVSDDEQGRVYVVAMERIDVFVPMSFVRTTDHRPARIHRPHTALPERLG